MLFGTRICGELRVSIGWMAERRSLSLILQHPKVGARIFALPPPQQSDVEEIASYLDRAAERGENPVRHGDLAVEHCMRLALLDLREACVEQGRSEWLDLLNRGFWSDDGLPLFSPQDEPS